jgi:hypothetical protein
MGSFGEINEYGHPMKSQFLFDPKWTNLNHGTYSNDIWIIDTAAMA